MNLRLSDAHARRHTHTHTYTHNAENIKLLGSVEREISAQPSIYISQPIRAGTDMKHITQQQQQRERVKKIARNGMNGTQRPRNRIRSLAHLLTSTIPNLIVLINNNKYKSSMTANNWRMWSAMHAPLHHVHMNITLDCKNIL